ncbi:MAG: elongation factor 1-beta [Candidatus Methylarchaceae archaeon HK01B]|nr:elongation factor 1-beta [Candidatus Methylarchaceae archaeon HK01M]MCP8312411.1 elongation factor 1-beta [Candidatus Methylarchaceae archaeon HK02M1]MCP8318644.1 elongation factor 1-beta [Candidatus Methylarchaceae archaeon HK01B]
MGRVLVRLRVLPKDADIGPDKVSESIQKRLPSNIEVKKVIEEPIAFGLTASIIDFLIEEREGEIDRLEEAIQSSDLVSQIEVIGVSKFSTSLR